MGEIYSSHDIQSVIHYAIQGIFLLSCPESGPGCLV
jgi:hypothetical protein